MKTTGFVNESIKSENYDHSQGRTDKFSLDSSASIGEAVEKAKGDFKKVYAYHRSNWQGNVERLQADFQRVTKHAISAGMNALNSNSGRISWFVNKPVSLMRGKLHDLEHSVIERFENAFQSSPEEALHKDEVSRFLDEGGPAHGSIHQ